MGMNSDGSIFPREHMSPNASERATLRKLEAKISELTEERRHLRDAVMYLVNYYDESNPVRTASLHPIDCMCTRCVVDTFRTLLEDVTASEHKEWLY